MQISTSNDIASTAGKNMVPLLNQNLADGIDLYSQIKQAHWNVKGPQFIALHELFDKVAGEIQEYNDEVAERAVQLGGVAEGTIRKAASLSRLPEYNLGAASGKDHVEALSRAVASYGQSIRSAIDEADQAGDKDTADIFTEISRGVDKALWMIEAHNQPL